MKKNNHPEENALFIILLIAATGFVFILSKCIEETF